MSRSRRLVTQLKSPSIAKIFRFFDEVAYVQEDSPPANRFSTELKSRIEALKLTACHNNLVSLSSNQCQVRHMKMFVINRLASQVSLWKDGKYSKVEDYEEFVNPKIVGLSDDTELSAEECPSLPYMQAKVERFRQVSVEYYDNQKNKIRRKLVGFQARVFQHEFDHSLGKILTYLEVNRGELEIDPKIIEQFPKSQYVLDELKKNFKELIKEYPGIIKKPTLDTINKVLPPLQVSFQSDLLRRLGKRMRKQMAIYEARKSLNM